MLPWDLFYKEVCIPLINCNLSFWMFPSSGPTLAADRRLPDELYHDCSSSANQYSPSRLKEEPYKHYTLVHSEVSDASCPHARPQATKGSKPPGQDVVRNTRGAEGLRGDRSLACPLLSGLVLGKGEQVGQPLPVQMVMEQRRRLCMMEAPYSHRAAAYPQPAAGNQQCEAAAELQPRCAEDGRRMLIGMGVGVGLPQAPYMSLNFHQVLGKHSSIKSPPFTTLSHIADSQTYQGKDTASYSCNSQSPSSSSSPESHREISHYVGTSVIITNERWPRTEALSPDRRTSVSDSFILHSCRVDRCNKTLQLLLFFSHVAHHIKRSTRT